MKKLKTYNDFLNESAFGLDIAKREAIDILNNIEDIDISILNELYFSECISIYFKFNEHEYIISKTTGRAGLSYYMFEGLKKRFFTDNIKNKNSIYAKLFETIINDEKIIGKFFI